MFGRRKTPRVHIVKPTNPRYHTDAYLRGRGLRALNPARGEYVEMDLSDPNKAEEAIQALRVAWEEATPLERRRLLGSLKEAVAQCDVYLKRTEDADERGAVVTCQTMYNRELGELSEMIE